MTDEREPNEPNDAGFSGEPATPEPEHTGTPPERTAGEEVAVPAGDLTGALTDAITPGDDD